MLITSQLTILAPTRLTSSTPFRLSVSTEPSALAALSPPSSRLIEASAPFLAKLAVSVPPSSSTLPLITAFAETLRMLLPSLLAIAFPLVAPIIAVLARLTVVRFPASVDVSIPAPSPPAIVPDTDTVEAPAPSFCATIPPSRPLADVAVMRSSPPPVFRAVATIPTPVAPSTAPLAVTTVSPVPLCTTEMPSTPPVTLFALTVRPDAWVAL